MRRTFVTGTLVFRISRFKMTAVVACENNRGVVVNTHFLKLIDKPAYIIINPVDCENVIRVHFVVIALKKKKGRAE